ncbi:MAG: fibronectin type III domain-containing protein [Patescibacteria group bacterium]|nr:fibronectin type III domain-containing protein [Patescibacteria group bacterium]
MKKQYSSFGLGLALAGGGALLSLGAIMVPLTASAQEATTTPVISSVVATPTDTTAAITWSTDVSSNSQVKYGTTTSYGTFSALNSTEGTSHSVTLAGLTPNTMYHFAALSQTGSSSQAVSPDQTFTTLTSSTTASTTAPTISAISATPTDTGATITWNTDVPATTQVSYGTTTGSYTASSTMDSSLNTSHSAILSGLAPSTTYHFIVMSNNSSGVSSSSADQMFTTLLSSTTATTTGGTGTSTQQDLINQINSLWAQLQSLFSQLNALTGGSAGGTLWNISGIGTTGGGTPTIDQQGQTFSAGGVIDFGGRNFGHEETVTVMDNSGNTLATPHADGGGNFSTGSLRVPSTPGSYTYHFVGQRSGLSANATITVQ